MKPAVIYARVSSRDQEREGYSIPAQLKLLRDYAEKHGFRFCLNSLTLKRLKPQEGPDLAKWCGFRAMVMAIPGSS